MNGDKGPAPHIDNRPPAPIHQLVAPIHHDHQPTMSAHPLLRERPRPLPTILEQKRGPSTPSTKAQIAVKKRRRAPTHCERPPPPSSTYDNKRLRPRWINGDGMMTTTNIVVVLSYCIWTQ
ncbi:uncharacterized protein LACBIDRAFT_326612 [Laccaria bicolor S238N-H82]|uniref:Predicted protein n=1 Tax=Laccaria bicolor (strain S238N-H82 / ATCC MYA-4686) TaxID=486041 RepID=B0D979_LACBS|nr:uncharacterized protein LACBIDRAFT_326612 [Laccaria bicolor S238N-H82]EDR08965.1 predicted protein [Laccaria bicolor S238N-H82]|eukprot:XP_001880278.1 predicted protein [Laccaria bicolor S238N-H82]